ncbi:MAG: hypothetical protein LBH45_06985, partial [Campylobacteraceae bacterium]|nr:hypothetical protein [Campylobacteraceae bacterium]
MQEKLDIAQQKELKRSLTISIIGVLIIVVGIVLLYFYSINAGRFYREDFLYISTKNFIVFLSFFIMSVGILIELYGHHLMSIVTKNLY